ncbi:MAG: hypothetical protein JJ863_25345 [Deltaproteobacteria bacterium]|nr:hypothetical protein [Deltaproteobacteria bacterium]
MRLLRLALVVCLFSLGCGDGGSDGDGGSMSSVDGGPLTEAGCTGIGRTWCDGDCVDPRSDDDHCGACGVACESGVACRGGECGGACPSFAPVSCGTECCTRCDATGLACIEPSVECPESPPADGERCVDVGYTFEGARCDYLRCADEGFVSARCDAYEETWSVTSTECGDLECGGTTCAAPELCVERVGGALLTECEPSPCGDGPLYTNCMCSLCPEGSGCSVSGRTVTCNTCTDAPCP